jgi:hypothetical protein
MMRKIKLRHCGVLGQASALGGRIRVIFISVVLRIY